MEHAVPQEHLFTKTRSINVMKKAIILSLCIACCCFQTLTGQVKKPAATTTKKPGAKASNIPKPIKADAAVLTSKIYSLARATRAGILIRWAPADEGAWSLGNKYGYVI